LTRPFQALVQHFDNGSGCLSRIAAPSALPFAASFIIALHNNRLLINKNANQGHGSSRWMSQVRKYNARIGLLVCGKQTMQTFNHPIQTKMRQ
jgi:hypothetical protein